MRRCKITVVAKKRFDDIIEGYSSHKDDHPACDCMAEGQVFYSENFCMPSNFCGWAWGDLERFVHVAMTGGDYARAGIGGDEPGIIACCTDGYRPVVFLLEGVDD